MTKDHSSQVMLRVHDRESLKSDYAGMFWLVYDTRKNEDGMKMSDLARACGKNKTTISHWFSGEPPNWEEHTLADIARGLDVEIIVQARDRKNPARIFTPFGIEHDWTATAPLIELSDGSMRTRTGAAFQVFRYSATA